MSDTTIESNIDDIERWENALVDSIDFTSPGEDQSLGRDMARDVATGIHERTVDQQLAADGSSLLPNKDPYKTWKETKLGVYQPLVKTGHMLSLESLIGDVAVGPDEIVMTYGTGATPSRSAAPMGGLGKGDAAVTDRQKAEYVSGDRPFYGLDGAITDRLMDRAGEAFDKMAREQS